VSVLLDTSFVAALKHPDDRNSARATELYASIVEGEEGAAFITDYIVDEALTLLWVRTKRSDLVLSMADFLLAADPTERPARLLHVGEESFDETARLHRRHHTRLSFTDCSSLAVMAGHDIGKIATFEGGFSGLCEVLQ